MVREAPTMENSIVLEMWNASIETFLLFNHDKSAERKGAKNTVKLMQSKLNTDFHFKSY